MASHLPLPKYHQVYLSLREQLNDGCFAEGLPGEMALMRQFGVARVTVRRALEQMASEGLIHREPGKGTRLAEKSASNAPNFGSADRGAQLTGLLENLVSMSRRTSAGAFGWTCGRTVCRRAEPGAGEVSTVTATHLSIGR